MRAYHASPHELGPGLTLTPQGVGNFNDGSGRAGLVCAAVDLDDARTWGIVIGAGRHDLIHIYAVDMADGVVEDSGFYDLPQVVAPTAVVLAQLGSFDPNR